jgi:hypothetical protein
MNTENWILNTNDKDFGEKIYREQHSHRGGRPISRPSIYLDRKGVYELVQICWTKLKSTAGLEYLNGLLGPHICVFCSTSGGQMVLRAIVPLCNYLDIRRATELSCNLPGHYSVGD